MRRNGLILMVVGWVLVSSGARGGELAVWTRDIADAKTLLQPAQLRQEVRELADPQYGRIHLYRGTPLEALFAAAPAKAGTGVDLALLHFQNGMTVPVHFLDRDEVQRMDAFVAFAWAPPTADGRSLVWSARFPPLAKEGVEKRDRRPLRFVGNKVVVRSGWHPAVPESVRMTFTPWRYLDSLVGIEYVREAEYYAPFLASAPGLKEGFETFQSRCQFCHGAGGRGGQYGWDLVEPVPIYKYRGAKSLELHVRYRELDAPERGFMMPAFPELDAKRLEMLWRWMEELAKRKEGG